MSPVPNSVFRLRKHADYQRVYKASRKQFSKQIAFFYTMRTDAELTTPRIGLTVGKVMGKAVDRNRIKRRMREAVRRNVALLDAPVDVILHPRRTVIDMEFAALDREVRQVFTTIASTMKRRAATPVAIAPAPSTPNP